MPSMEIKERVQSKTLQCNLKMNSKLSHGMHTQKKLRQIREKSYGGPKLIDENNFTIKTHKKNQIFKFQCSMMIHFQDMIFFSGLSKFFLCAYRGSILNSSLALLSSLKLADLNREIVV